MRLKFTKDYAVSSADDKGKAKTGDSYKAGEVYEFEDSEAGNASAQHFLKRGVAVEEGEEKERRGVSRKVADAPKQAAPKSDSDEAKAADGDAGNKSDAGSDDARKPLGSRAPEALVPKTPKGA